MARWTVILGIAVLASCGGSGSDGDSEEFRTTFGYFLATGNTSVSAVIMRIVGERDLTLIENHTGSTQNPALGFIAGQVTDSSGAPIANVTVAAHNDSGLPAGSIFYQSNVNAVYATGLTMTTATGRFVVMNVQVGRINLKCMSGANGNLYVRMEGGAAAFVQLSSTAVGAQPDWSGLTANLVASGRMVSGNPEPSVNYQLLGTTGAPGPASDATTGAFNLATVPARSTYIVKCTKSAFVDTYTYVLTENADLTPGLGGGNVFITSLANRDNELNASGVVLAPGTGIITGRVLHSVGGFTVEARDAGDQVVGVVRYGDNADGGRPNPALTGTDVNGIFYVYNVPPGLVFLRATSATQAVSTYVDAFADGVTVMLDQTPLNQLQATITISGALATSLTGFAVPDGRVALKGLGLTDESDVFGEYALTGVPTSHVFIVRTSK